MYTNLFIFIRYFDFETGKTLENVTYNKDENKISFTATVCDEKGVLGKTSSLMFTTEDAIHLKGALDHCVASAEHKAYEKKQEQLMEKKTKSKQKKKKKKKEKKKEEKKEDEDTEIITEGTPIARIATADDFSTTSR